jgi:geranyl-CoA carboxylase beta subunit
VNFKTWDSLPVNMNESAIRSDSEEFRLNQTFLKEQILEFRTAEKNLLDRALQSKSKFEKLAQLLPRERLDLLLDPGSPFVEICALAGYGMYGDKDGSTAGGGMISGIGYIEGVRCAVNVNNCAIKGGTINPAGLEKTLRIQRIAGENRLPLVTLAQSGGANLNYAADIFIPGARTFANQSRLSAAGIPQVTVVHGNATAGGAYQPGLSDYLVLVEGASKMFLAGPPLLKAATGEIASDEELGGATLHSVQSGTGEFLARNDQEGIKLARLILRDLSWNSAGSIHPVNSKPPRYSEEEILGIIPSDPRKPYDVREVLLRLVDDSQMLEFKAQYDRGTICVFASIYGYPCGFLGNNGPITVKGAQKATQFMQLCDQADKPLIFLHNTTGFLVGKESEAGGIIKQGSKMIQAVTNVRVPRISLVIGGSFGAGNYAMCGRGMDPSFIFSWPNAKTAVMGGAQAGKVMRIISEQDYLRRGLEPDEDRLKSLEETTTTQLEGSSSALFGTARLWDDGIIDPRDSRRLLGFLIQSQKEAAVRTLKGNTFGVARM